jgi:hypothetical protein
MDAHPWRHNAETGVLTPASTIPAARMARPVGDSRARALARTSVKTLPVQHDVRSRYVR